MIELLTISILSAIVAYVFCEILCDPDMIFGWYIKFIALYFPRWLYNPFGGCTYCFAGQISLWTFIIYFRKALIFIYTPNDYITINTITLATLNILVRLIITICLTLFFIKIIKYGFKEN
jgi:hypothetical protein